MMEHKTLYVCKASAGTGKTYTLAAHYVALLMSGVSYKNILAVTFTNKATAEMKERVITYLNAIAYSPELDDTKGFLRRVREVSDERGLKKYSDKEYSEKAKALVQSILSDYDNMRISTIDAFLQTLLTGLAQALGQAAGYGVDLDIKHAITSAVDEVLSTEVQEREDVRDAVVKCLNERLKNETKWDLRPSLIQMAQELYSENVQIIRDRIVFPSSQHPTYAEQLDAYREKLDRWKECEAYKAFTEAYKAIREYGESLATGTGGKNYGAFFSRCEAIYKGMPGKFGPLGKTDRARFDNPGKLDLSPAVCAQIGGNVDIINENLATLERLYTSRKLKLHFLNELMLVGYVIDRVKHNLREGNTILLAETAYTLFRALKEHDAEFVLLKAGIRYKHIMLDEFQDTSTLQWSNFRQLIEEIVSQEGGSALIVGDVKQSIYRWRNGDYSIMNGLSNPIDEPTLYYSYNEQHLSRNFRSRKNVVEFNLSTFKALSAEEGTEVEQMYDEQFDTDRLEEYYVHSKEGGYVCLRNFVPESNDAESNESARVEMLTFMFDKMEQLLQAGYRKKDMLILCRTSGEAQRVLKIFYRLLQTQASLYPSLLAAGKIVSGDSFRLESSVAVNIIISALKVIERKDGVAERYLVNNLKDIDIETIRHLNGRLPLTDLIEKISRLCLCPDGQYRGSDIAHLNCLRDKVRSYIGRYGSNIEDFLTYWDDKMHGDSVPTGESDDIRIMTIHSSKGLEAKNVFIPFCQWEMEGNPKKPITLWCEEPELHPEGDGSTAAMLPILYGSDMERTGYQAIREEERRKLRIDALNLLYVACTRAQDNLFILVYGNGAKQAGGLLTQLYGGQRDWGEGLQTPETTDRSKEPRAKMPKPFSFEEAEAETAEYKSSDADIEFRQSQQARQLMLESGENNEQNENIQFGNLCHAILEKVQTEEDVVHVIQDFYLRGMIPTEKGKTHIEHLINMLMRHPVAGSWFDGSWRLLREDTIFTCQHDEVIERRVDRVMIKENEAVVLDYKFGTMKNEYFDQVRDYMSSMRQMGYRAVRGFLWLGFKGELVEVRL